jgi:hypothetical protein
MGDARTSSESEKRDFWILRRHAIAGWLIYSIDPISNSVKLSPKKNGVRQDPAFPNHLIERPPIQRRSRQVVHWCD